MIIIYIILGLILLVSLVAIIMPSKYIVKKEVIINKPTADVFGKVANLNHYKDWNPWQKSEPGAKSQITGSPLTVGHKFGWEGKKIGTGSLTIKSLVPNNNIELDLEFLKPWKSQASDSWNFEDLNNGSTKVVWHNTGPLPFGFARLMGPVITKNLNHQFEIGLSSLKKMCEN